jgi:hypothetical protein
MLALHQPLKHTIQHALESINRVLNISDDIIIFGKTTAEHDKALKEIFRRLSEKRLTLNPDNCVKTRKILIFWLHFRSSWHET